jgi:hypothetical protein
MPRCCRRRTVDPRTPNAADGKIMPKPTIPLPAVGGSKGCNHYFPGEQAAGVSP